MKKLSEDIAERFALPPEAFGTVPGVSISGTSRVLVENHKGLLSYSLEVIDISTGKGLIRVRGENLLIRAMDRGSILISGRIMSVDLE